MAERTAGELTGLDGVPRSLSDRPIFVRWLVNTQRFMIGKPLGGFGVLVIVVVAFAAAFPQLLTRYDPNADVFYIDNVNYDPVLAEQSIDDPTIRLNNPGKIDPVITNSLGGINGKHWFGTDNQGRDLYTRVVYGARLAVVVGVGAALIATIAGTFLGIVSAYFGGIVDMTIQRFVDSFQAFPGLVLLLLLTQVVGEVDRYTIMGALGVLGIAPVIRIVRSAVLVTRSEVFVTAARVVGAGDLRVMLRHILPNIVAPIIVIFTISIGVYILLEATLQFIGLGDPTAVSWGRMINEARVFGAAAPRMALIVGTALTVTVLAYNLAGDALRDALDPRLRGGGGRPGF